PRRSASPPGGRSRPRAIARRRRAPGGERPRGVRSRRRRGCGCAARAPGCRRSRAHRRRCAAAAARSVGGAASPSWRSRRRSAARRSRRARTRREATATLRDVLRCDGTPIEAVLLDLDDTRLDNQLALEPAWDLVAELVAERLGDIAAADVRAQLGRSSEGFWSDEERHRAGRLDMPAARRAVLAARGVAPLPRLPLAGAALAGLRAVEALRARGFDGRILWVGAERHLPYDRPPLSKEVLRGEWEPTQIALARRGVEGLDTDLRLGRRAVGLDAASRRLALEGGERAAVDGVVIATGASPRPLPRHPELAGVPL